MDRGKHISSCFIDEHIDFKYPNDVEDFDNLLEFFREKNTM